MLQQHHTIALVLGNGGASKAVQYVLRKKGIDYLVVTRNTAGKENHIAYNNIDEAIMNEYPVIINCSPVGMYPKDSIAPAIPYQFISSRHYLYDLVYKPEETLFLKEGKQRGAATQNGFEMLLIQAEESWRIWNNG